MDKRRIELIATLVLIIIFVLVAARSCSTIRQRFRPRPAPSVSATPQPPAIQEVTVTRARKVKQAVLEWVRCPFCGKNYSDRAQRSDLRLNGIFWDEVTPRALISNTIVREGDRIGNCTILRIQKESVVLNDGVGNFELTLQQ